MKELSKQQLQELYSYLVDLAKDADVDECESLDYYGGNFDDAYDNGVDNGWVLGRAGLAQDLLNRYFGDEIVKNVQEQALPILRGSNR